MYLHKNILTILAQLGLMIVLFFFLALIYILALRSTHSETVYYFGIGAITVGVALALVLSLILPKNLKKRLSQTSYIQSRDFFPCLLVAALIMYSFHITVPTLADRSISIYLLNQLANQNGSAPIDTLQKQFLAGYVGGYSVVCRRMAEQMETGDVTHAGKIYSLTPRGEKAIWLLRAFTKITGVNPYYVASSNPHELPYHYVVTDNGCELTNSTQ